MIDLDTLRKANGYMLAIVDESTGEYKPVSSDVVQVVRCKECWCWNEEEQHGCTHDMGANDFCSRAERKEE